MSQMKDFFFEASDLRENQRQITQHGHRLFFLNSPISGKKMLVKKNMFRVQFIDENTISFDSDYSARNRWFPELTKRQNIILIPGNSEQEANGRPDT